MPYASQPVSEVAPSGPGYPRGTAWMATPLPGPPKVDLDWLLDKLKGLRVPEVPELPTKPQWMREMESKRGVPPQWQPVPGTDMEQLDPASVQHYNDYFGSPGPK